MLQSTTPTPTTTSTLFAGPRLEREWRTVEAMIRIFCRERHGGSDKLCAECAELAAYASERLARCPFGEGKSTCANCRIHCYRARMKERIREVMRYAGPRMLFKHPILALCHTFDGRRAAPELERKRAARG